VEESSLGPGSAAKRRTARLSESIFNFDRSRGQARGQTQLGAVAVDNLFSVAKGWSVRCSSKCSNRIDPSSENP